MTDTYAGTSDLSTRLSGAYVLPTNAAQLLEKASELVDFATLGRAQEAWDAVPTVNLTAAQIAATKALLTQATCDQVEYWLEVGEEHDVVGLHGSLQGGRVQIGRLPGYLGQRALRTLLRAGLFWSGAEAV